MDLQGGGEQYKLALSTIPQRGLKKWYFKESEKRRHGDWKKGDGELRYQVAIQLILLQRHAKELQELEEEVKTLETSIAPYKLVHDEMLRRDLSLENKILHETVSPASTPVS